MSSKIMPGDSGFVPWNKPEQFHKVYQCLYSSDLSEKRWAVDQISVWESRCHPCLPSYVEATFVLVRAIIQDTLFENNATLCQERDIELMYAMALVRFVNITTEVFQTSATHMSLSMIASKLDIPQWIVSLRNEATHAYCPTLPVLRMGAVAAMRYLNKTFWLPLVSSLQIMIKTPKTYEQEMYSLISSFQYHQCEKLLRHIPIYTESKYQQELLKTIRSYIKKYGKSFIKIFVQVDAFIFTEDVMKDILPDDEKHFFNDDEGCFLPKTFEDFWMPIIVILHNYDLIPAFLETLLLTQEDRELIEQKYAIAWVIKILQYVALIDQSNSCLSYIFEQQGTLFDFGKLLFSCLKHPCKYTAFLFPLLVSLLELNEEWTRKYMYLCAIFQGQALDIKSNSLFEDHVFTVDDIKRDKKRKCSSKADNIWTVAPDNINFSKLPIGAILNATGDDKIASEEEILEVDDMNIDDNTEKCILNYESDKEQEEENININSSKKDEETNSSKNEENVHMVYKRRK